MHLAMAILERVILSENGGRRTSAIWNADVAEEAEEMHGSFAALRITPKIIYSPAAT